MHEDKFLSSWLREGTESKAAELEEMRNTNTEEEGKSGKRELEGQKERVAVVCNRICCDFPSSMGERFPEGSLENEVVVLSCDESEHWCEVSVCVFASVLLVGSCF